VSQAALAVPAGAFAWTRDLFATLVQRDLKLRYKRSLLGVAWSILNPLAYLAVLQLVFGRLMPLDVPRYTSFLFTGLLAWGWFSSSLLWAATAVLDHGDLIRQPRFPPVVLLPVRVTSDLIHFLIALPVLFGFLLADGGGLTLAALALPGLVALQFFLTLGPALMVSALHVRYRDTQYLLSILLHLGFFLTPIFYDVGTLPARYARILELNPLADLIAAYRAVLVEGRLPDPGGVAVVAVVATVLLLLGTWVFRRAQFGFAEEVG
jgi:lipopolysaccharide transport system permease protein